MSKRHQSSRRKAYGRRQHEIHERVGRRDDPQSFDLNVSAEETTTYADSRPFGFGGPAVRLRFALLD